MQRRKSPRHQRAARARWRAAEARAQAERDAGITDEPMPTDCRQPFDLLLSSAGGRDLHIVPRPGYVAWIARDARTGEVVERAALKELLHRVADSLPRMMSPRSL